MLNKICFLVNYNLYETKRHFTIRLCEALNRQGVETRIIDVREQTVNSDTLLGIKRYAPDLTASFNSLLPLSDGRQLSDHLQIPHLAILVDPAIYSMSLTQSPYSLISCVDRSDVAGVRSNDFHNVFFWPHAVERELTAGKESGRLYDVVFLGSCYDYESLRASWRQRNPEAINQLLDDAIDIFFGDPKCSLAEALVGAWNRQKLSPETVDFPALFYYLDNYTRGKDRMELIRSIKDANVHVFGDLSTDNAVGVLGWKQYLARQPNVTIHASVPFGEALNVMRNSKICLNSSPFFKDGSHERPLFSLACGAVPITTESRYFREQFVADKEMFFYSMNDRKAVNDLVNDLIGDDAKRNAAAAAGRAKVLKHHTWDQRAEQLMKELPPMLMRVQSTASKA